MKRKFSLFLAVVMILSLCGCQGNLGKVNLQDAIAIPEDGVIKQNVIEQMRDENAIGSFYGESNGIKYEWTIFGSDIGNAKEVNLLAAIQKTADGGVRIILPQAKDFGFSALLSVHLNEKLEAQSATAYQKEAAVASVSLTGTKQTILNISTDGTLGTFVIQPDPLPEDHTDTEAVTETTDPDTDDTQATTGSADYLSGSKGSDGEVYTDGKDKVLTAPIPEGKPKSVERDKYLTTPIPEGKPTPVEPEDQEVDKEETYTCVFSIECSAILNNIDLLDPDKLEMVPSNGVILAKTSVPFYEGESVFDVLQRVCREKGIHMESSWTPIYNSAYIEGIHNLYEFDCGSLSGWMYRVNGWYPNYGCSRYQLQDGDTVEWRYTCDLGGDVGGGWLFG